jgi:hypothetical protein
MNSYDTSSAVADSFHTFVPQNDPESLKVMTRFDVKICSVNVRSQTSNEPCNWRNIELAFHLQP